MTLSTTHAATDTGVRDWAAGAATGLAAIVGPWINDEIAFGLRWRTLSARLEKASTNGRHRKRSY